MNALDALVVASFLLFSALAVPSVASSAATPDPMKPSYVPSPESGVVTEMEGEARVRRRSSAVFHTLRLGSRLYQGDTVFVSESSRVLLEETNSGSMRTVSIPSLSVYQVGEQDGTSDLNIRNLIPNADDVEERLANAKSSQINQSRSPLGRFDLRTLGVYFKSSVLGLEGARVDKGFRYERMTTLSVWDLHPLTILSPRGDVHLMARAAHFPDVIVRFAQSKASRLMLSVWREAPRLQAIGSAYLAPGRRSLSWRPPEEGTYALQLLSLDGALKSRVIRVFATQKTGAGDPLPPRLRPGDTVVLAH